MNKIEEAMANYWGERCPDYLAECDNCQAWKQYDAVVKVNKALVNAIPFIGYEGAGADQAVKQARLALAKLKGEKK